MSATRPTTAERLEAIEGHLREMAELSARQAAILRDVVEESARRELVLDEASRPRVPGRHLRLVRNVSES